jgi:G3E family GTPase
VLNSIRSINAVAQVIVTKQCRANLDQLMGMRSFSLNNVSHLLEQLEDDEKSESAHGHTHGHSHSHFHDCGDCKDALSPCSHGSHAGHGHEHAHEQGHGDGHCKEAGCSHDAPAPKKPERSAHLSGVSSTGIEIDSPLVEAKFNEFMQKLLQEKARDLYRCKGVVAFASSEDKYVFHGVHEQVAFCPTQEGWAGHSQKKVCKRFSWAKTLTRTRFAKGSRPRAPSDTRGLLPRQSPSPEAIFFSRGHLSMALSSFVTGRASKEMRRGRYITVTFATTPSLA